VQAADLGDDAQLHGLVAFVFACHGAGTAAFHQFPANHAKEPVPIAGPPFVAARPQRLLSHPNGPALAVFGRVERAWATRSGYGVGMTALAVRQPAQLLPEGQANGVYEK
jgi:hypothetical protein